MIYGNIWSFQLLLRIHWHWRLKFLWLLKASEESLHKHIEVIVLTFLTWVLAIKSKFALSHNYCDMILNLISDILLANYKMPKDVYGKENYCLMSAWIILCFFGTRPKLQGGDQRVKHWGCEWRWRKDNHRGRTKPSFLLTS